MEGGFEDQSMISTIAQAVHVLAAVAWVGGIFAYMAPGSPCKQRHARSDTAWCACGCRHSHLSMG